MPKVDLSREERRAIEEFLRSRNLPTHLAVTFGDTKTPWKLDDLDATIPEDYSDIRSRSEISFFETRLSHNLELGIPFVAANMESVTGAEMIIAIQREGGLGILPPSLPLDKKLEILERVRRADCALIEDPICVTPEVTLGEAKRLMEQNHVTSLIVVSAESQLGNRPKPVGILSTRDWLYETNPHKKVGELMSQPVITAPRDINFDEAGKILKKHKIEKLPLVDENGVLAGLITAHGLFYLMHHPRALRNEKGQFLRVGCVGVGRYFTEKHLEEVYRQAETGIAALSIETARAYSINVDEALQKTIAIVRKHFPTITLIVGNVSTPEGVKSLCELGVDVVKSGVGPGRVCRTRRVGIGIPQLFSIARNSVITRRYGRTLIADGGFRGADDITKAIIAGANAVMLGFLLAGTEESAEPAYQHELKELNNAEIRVKDYFGSASFEAQRRRVQRGDLDRIRRPEGVREIVPVLGTVSDRINDLLDAMRSAMAYLGARNLRELFEKGRFELITQTGKREGTKK